jgi:hypothetical protein
MRFERAHDFAPVINELARLNITTSDDHYIDRINELGADFTEHVPYASFDSVSNDGALLQLRGDCYGKTALRTIRSYNEQKEMLRVYFSAAVLAPLDIVLCPKSRAWAKRMTTTSNLRAARNRASCLPVVTLAWRSNRHTLTTLSTASVDHLTSSLGRHSLAKTMGRLSALLTGLICAFHNPYYLTTRRLS